MNIAVYCSASDAVAEKYFDAARAVGCFIAKEGHTLLYGGTFMGLMGAVAKSNARAGGERIGIITEGIFEMEKARVDEHNLLMTKELTERKAKLIELADLHIVLSGGFGTLDEALSILAKKQVGEAEAPVIFLNTEGFYDALQQQFSTYYQEDFANEDFQKSYYFCSDVDDLKGVLVSGIGK